MSANLPPAVKIALYDALVALVPEAERKGKTMPYTSVNGHMFSFLDKEGKCSIRFGAEDLMAFIAEFDTENSVQHGRVMKEYAIVPDRLLETPEVLSPYLQKSLDYVKTLKPKPTKKK